MTYLRKRKPFQPKPTNPNVQKKQLIKKRRQAIYKSLVKNFTVYAHENQQSICIFHKINFYMRLTRIPLDTL